MTDEILLNGINAIEKKLFCKRCGIFVENDRSHCPVCGKCVSEDNLNNPREFKYYPKYTKWKNERRNITLFTAIALIIVNLVLLAVELLISKGSIYYYWYFLGGSVLFLVLVLWPYAKRYNFLTKSVVGVTAVSLYVLFIDLYVKFHYPEVFFGWAPSIVIPMVLLACGILVGFIMLLRGYYKRSALYPSLYIALLATALFIINVSLKSIANRPNWPSIAVFAASWGFFLSLFLFRYKKIWKGIKKDFHI